MKNNLIFAARILNHDDLKRVTSSMTVRWMGAEQQQGKQFHMAATNFLWFYLKCRVYVNFYTILYYAVHSHFSQLHKY